MSSIMHKLAYLSFFICGAALSFYKFFLLAAIIDKSEFGLYVLTMSIYVYFIYVFSFGANEYVLKIGSLVKNSYARQVIRNEALLNGLLGVSLGVALLFPISLALSLEYRLVFNSAALLALVTLPFSIFETYFRTESALLKFSGMMAAKAAIVVAIISFSSSLSSFQQAVNAELIGSLAIFFIVFVCFIFSGQSMKGIISIEKIKTIVFQGYSFCISTMLRNGAVVLDKIFISLYLGSLHLGFYGFVFIIYQASLLSSSVIMSVVGPNILRFASEDEKKSKLKRNLTIAVICLFIVLFFSYPVIYDIYHWLVGVYFEQYNDPVTFMIFPLIYFAAVFSFASSLLDWFFISISKERMLALYSLLSLVFLIVGFLLIGNIGLGVAWFAFVFFAGKFIVFMFQMIYMLKFNDSKCDVCCT
ncbi:oligosaccharide flippase family protein [Nitrincola iocasae]|uniref:Oligosaccharide flippase family protein n=2 Tax=Nitrincola iocasae TaxID=2614693 RepID=A0A5J6LBE2_9GAMM|nr:oligosaccharide flippase family protein [Nitrincola iocasae]